MWTVEGRGRGEGRREVYIEGQDEWRLEGGLSLLIDSVNRTSDYIDTKVRIVMGRRENCSWPLGMSRQGAWIV